MKMQLTAREALAVREIISSLATIVGILIGVVIAQTLYRLHLRWTWALVGFPLIAALWLAGSPYALASLAATATTLCIALLFRLATRLEERKAECPLREELGPLQLALALLRPADPSQLPRG
jgi:uncharacterized membrane protein YccC